MKQEFPPEIEKSHPFNAAFPMWWVRGVVINVQEVERPTGDEKLKHLRDLHVQVGDVDGEDAYDIRIEGNWHNIEQGDVVSLLGHEHYQNERISYPRLFINHNTLDYRRAWPPASRLTYGVMPSIERKYWLSAKHEAMLPDRLKNVWKLLAVVFLPFVLIFGLGGPIGIVLGGIMLFMLFGPLLLGGWLLGKYFRWIVDYPRFSWEQKEPPPLIIKNIQDYVNFKRYDQTASYERLAKNLLQWAAKNPDPAAEWVPLERGTHTVGALKRQDTGDIYARFEAAEKQFKRDSAKTANNALPV